MEKISGIIPTSPRVQTVDLKNSAPIRPGIPTFGRPQGNNSLADRQAVTTAERAASTHQEVLAQRKSQADRDVEAVQDITDRFFMRSTPSRSNEHSPILEVGVGGLPIEGPRSELWEAESPAFGAESTEGEQHWGLDPELNRYTPPGTYLDVEV